MADCTERRRNKWLKKISQEIICYWHSQNETNLGKEKQNTNKSNNIYYITISAHKYKVY